METYFILDAFGNLKIGKSKDFKSRLSQIKTSNPYIIYYWKIKGDYEKQLHKYFDEYKIKGEWFCLTNEYYLSKSLLSFSKWIKLEVMVYLSAIRLNKINSLIDIRLKRYIIY